MVDFFFIFQTKTLLAIEVQKSFISVIILMQNNTYFGFRVVIYVSSCMKSFKYSNNQKQWNDCHLRFQNKSYSYHCKKVRRGGVGNVFLNLQIFQTNYICTSPNPRVSTDRAQRENRGRRGQEGKRGGGRKEKGGVEGIVGDKTLVSLTNYKGGS